MKVTVGFPQNLAQRIQKAATSSRVSVNQVIVAAVEEGIDAAVEAGISPASPRPQQQERGLFGQGMRDGPAADERDRQLAGNRVIRTSDPE